jgi:hypothetical protein
VLQLSRRWLTLSLIAVTLIPVMLAATVWFAIPSQPEPVLPVEMTLEPVAWPPGSTDSVRLMPGVHLHNPTNEPWTNVSMGINKQFYFYSPDPLPAGGDMRVPWPSSAPLVIRSTGPRTYRLNV